MLLHHPDSLLLLNEWTDRNDKLEEDNLCTRFRIYSQILIVVDWKN